MLALLQCADQVVAVMYCSLPTTCLWSPTLIPKPHDWGSHITVAGFLSLSDSVDSIRSNTSSSSSSSGSVATTPSSYHAADANAIVAPKCHYGGINLSLAPAGDDCWHENKADQLSKHHADLAKSSAGHIPCLNGNLHAQPQCVDTIHHHGSDISSSDQEAGSDITSSTLSSDCSSGGSSSPLADSAVTDYQPPEHLLAFLQSGPAPVYIGFGSVVVDKADSLTSAVLEAVAQSGVRAVLCTGWAGVGSGVDDSKLPAEVCCVVEAPHEWLFPRWVC